MSQTSRIDPESLAAARLLWDYHRIHHAPKPADAIIGLGSYDLRVADRCAELHAAGLAPVVLFTGGAGNWTAGLYASSEAAAFRDRALARGVPPEAVLIEEEATNIGENLRFSLALLPGLRSAILVTKPQTQRRCLATAQRQWPSIEAIVTAPLHGMEEQPTAHHPMASLICEMVGDTWRMTAYPRRSFQSEQPMPEAVGAAFELLVSRGFTQHLPAEALP